MGFRGTALLLLLLFAAPMAADAAGSVRVRGYYKKDGTYVAPHYRSAPDSSKSNNWSSQGNYNPHTGKRGTVNPYSAPSSPPIYYVPPTPSYAPGVFQSTPRGVSYSPAPPPAPSIPVPSFSGGAVSALFNTESLYKSCVAGIDAAENRTTAGDATACLDYVRGFWDGMDVVQGMTGTSLVCLPEGMTYYRAAKVFVAFVDTNPHTVGQSPATVLTDAMVGAYGCNKSP